MKTHQTKKSTGKTHQMAATHNVGQTGISLEDNRTSSGIQQQKMDAIQSNIPIQQKKNNTGLPDSLKAGMENLSGHSLDDVKVHYNSSKPAQLNAHAYAQGTNIHLASGQEKHLPHEAWHIIQQKQGRVQPTKTIAGAKINDNTGLEKEADIMGAKALQRKETSQRKVKNNSTTQHTIQLAKGKRQKALAKATKAEKEAERMKENRAKQIEDAIKYDSARSGGSRKSKGAHKRKKQEIEDKAFAESRKQVETHGHEQTHRNIITRPARRNSIAGANLLDTINPAGTAIPKTGLNLADFRARFQPLVQEGNIATGSLSTLLPQHKAVDFPPARGRDATTEIRAGRKWEIPNPDGGKHAIWVHTNDPNQADGNSSRGPIVRVRDSSGKHLSNQEIELTEHLRRQKAGHEGRGNADEAARIEANNTGFWTMPNDDRANSQHIPLV